MRGIVLSIHPFIMSEYNERSRNIVVKRLGIQVRNGEPQVFGSVRRKLNGSEVLRDCWVVSTHI